jgi:biotin synthase
MIRGREDLLRWLRTTDPAGLAELRSAADALRRERVGDAVHLRGLVEISNHCTRRCAYCGLNAERSDLPRYRLDEAAILACADTAARLGYGSIVLQAGEDPGLRAEAVAELVRALKSRHDLAVTLALGERDPHELALWREAGADRYLLKFETGNRDLYAAIHPARAGGWSGRLPVLHLLQGLGYETGSGILVGLPGQTLEDLADDLLLFRELELDMIGVGPYLPHPGTALGAAATPGAVARNTALALKVLALTRLICPDTNLPATTALAVACGGSGRLEGLRHGANVVMPNLTPTDVRADYDIYPGGRSTAPDADVDHADLLSELQALGRRPGDGHGTSPLYSARTTRPGGRS